MYQCRLHDLIAEKRVAVGMYLVSGSEMAAEIIGQTGLDYVIIETEHGLLSPMDLAPLAEICAILDSYGVTSIVRVPTGDPLYIGRSLDAGAMGVMVPRVKTKQDVEQIVTAAMFPPMGDRGVGELAPANRYVRPSMEYAAFSNEHIVISALIETKEAVENIDAITDVSGIGFLSIGAVDLALSLGVEDRSHPAVDEAREKVLQTCLAKGVPFHMSGHTRESATEALEKGARLITIADEPHLMYQATVDQIAVARAAREDLRQAQK